MARLLLLVKGLRRNIRQMLNPRKVEVVRNNGKVVDEKILDTINAYLAAYVLILFAVFAIISLDGFSVGTNFSAVLCTFNNIGRLEIFPILVLFSRETWKKR